MSYYNLKNVLTQSPEKLKLAILAIVGVAAGVRGWDPGLLETVGVGFAIERTLDLFYVAPVKAAANEANTLKAIDLGKQIATPVIHVGGGGASSGNVSGASGGGSSFQG